MTIFKKIIPYCLFLTAFASAGSDSFTNTFENTPENFKEKYKTFLKTTIEYKIAKRVIEYKTQSLMDTYIDNSVSGTKRIIKNYKRKNYLKSVRSELPGAPYDKKQGTLHCLYAQHTQLNRALIQNGDTIQIIPTTANAYQSSQSFKHEMTKLYDNPEYQGAIHRGHLYPTESEYKCALNRYIKLKMRGKKNNNPDSLRTKYTQDFAKNNYCANMLNPGSIIIVNTGHAVMYLGQGYVKNHEFIPDPNGTAICCAYNAEHPAVALNTWETTKSFAADIHKIANKKYEQESMHKDSLNNTNTYQFANQNLIAQLKYQNKKNNKNQTQTPDENQIPFLVLPTSNFCQHTRE